jgi:hypothetical protein
MIPVAEDFEQEEFEKTFLEHHLPIMLITDEEEAIPYSVDNQPVPKANSRVLVLVNPEEKDTLPSPRENTPVEEEENEDQLN